LAEQLRPGMRSPCLCCGLAVVSREAGPSAPPLVALARGLSLHTVRTAVLAAEEASSAVRWSCVVGFFGWLPPSAQAQP
jgi:hypothetical protein